MSTSKSKSSVSTSINLRYGRGIGRKSSSKPQRLRDGEERRIKAYAKYRERVAGLSYEDQEQLMQVDPEFIQDVELYPIPVGEEGILASHEGGEDDLCREIFETTKTRHDHRTRRDRTESRNAEWAAQMPQLVDAYLAWRQGTKPNDATAQYGDSGGTATSFENTWQMLAYHVYDSSSASFTSYSSSEPTNVTLVRHGFLGVAPTFPTLALSLHLLETYRQLHGACPRLSIQAFCQGLCGMHSRPFHHHLVEQVSIAYDAYLEILHQVDHRVATALARDGPDWRMRHACAPCLYVLDDEPSAPVLLATMDGNSSLKLVDDSFKSGEVRPDGRTVRTDIFLSSEAVERFKDEVRDAQARGTAGSSGTDLPPIVSTSAATPLASAIPMSSVATAVVQGRSSAADQRATAQAKRRGDASEAPDSAELDDGERDESDWIARDCICEDVNEPAEGQSICAEQWRNAGPEARKKMFALFAATGIFASICRHGQVLILCDMIRSGELMKYPLALVSKLLDVYGDDLKIMLGYDIGCEFAKTLKRSSLGSRADGIIKMVVPAFHGHSHNRGCQVQWHPMYVDGAGKEDFEGCERFFSQSNALASGTRLATAFHRHQAIEGHVQFWSMWKHAESGRFIFNNYRQALQIIHDGERALAVYAHDLKLTAANFERYLEEERVYLNGLKSEPPEYTLKFEYIEALHKLEDAGLKSAAAADRFRRLDEMIIQDGIIDKDIRRIRREYTTAPKRVQDAEEEVRRLEDLLDIEQRWLPTSVEYKEMTAELGCRKYRLALDNLERLVVQRMFELSKLGLSGTGYKLREKIGKALKARAEAIRRALSTYNCCAAELKPPRPELSLNEVMSMVSLGEFDLLRDTRQDIRQKPWAQPMHRDAMHKYFNVKRAHEEVTRLNLEIRRLFTSMVDDHIDHERAISALRTTDPPLAHELATRQQRLNAINENVVGWLLKTSRLTGFSGRVNYGHHRGRDKGLLQGVRLPPWAMHSPIGNMNDGAPSSSNANGGAPSSGNANDGARSSGSMNDGAPSSRSTNDSNLDSLGGRIDVHASADVSRLCESNGNAAGPQRCYDSAGIEVAHGVLSLDELEDDAEVENDGGIPGAGTTDLSGRLVDFLDGLDNGTDVHDWDSQ